MGSAVAPGQALTVAATPQNDSPKKTAAQPKGETGGSKTPAANDDFEVKGNTDLSKAAGIVSRLFGLRTEQLGGKQMGNNLEKAFKEAVDQESKLPRLMGHVINLKNVRAGFDQGRKDAQAATGFGDTVLSAFSGFVGGYAGNAVKDYANSIASNTLVNFAEATFTEEFFRNWGGDKKWGDHWQSELDKLRKLPPDEVLKEFGAMISTRANVLEQAKNALQTAVKNKDWQGLALTLLKILSTLTGVILGGTPGAVAKLASVIGISQTVVGLLKKEVDLITTTTKELADKKITNSGPEFKTMKKLNEYQAILADTQVFLKEMNSSLSKQLQGIK